MSDLYKSAEEAGLEVRRIGQGKPYTPGQLYRERTGRDYAPGDVSENGLTPPDVRRRGIATPNQEISPEQQEFLQGLLTETTAPEAKPVEQGFLGRAADLAVQGAKNTLTAVRVAPGVVSGNIDPETAGLIAEQYARPQVERPAELKEAEGAFAPAAEQWKEADGFMQGAAAIGSMVLAVGKQAVTNPKGVAYLTSEQLGNMIPSLVGMYAGAKIGAATGLVTPVPGGAAAGAVVGGIAGGFAGGAPVEIGSEFVGIVGKALQEMKVAPTQENIAALLSDQQFLTKAINDARVKGATTAGIDAALTLGAGSIATAPGRTALKTATKELGADASAAQITQRAKEILASRTLGQKVATGTKATGAEIIGEPISEAGGQAAAYGEIDLEQVGQEMLGGVGGAAMSVPTAAASLKDSRLRGDQKIVTDKSGPVTVSYPVDANGDPVRDANVDAAANNLTAAVDQYVSPSAPVNSQVEPVSAVQESNVPAPQSVRDRQLAIQAQIDADNGIGNAEARPASLVADAEFSAPPATAPIREPRAPLNQEKARQTIDRVSNQLSSFDSQMILEGSGMIRPEEDTGARFVDLSPMAPREAQIRLGILRDQFAQRGGDAFGLTIVQHPSAPNRFAIEQRTNTLPDLNIDRSGNPSRLESIALGQQIESRRREEDGGRQVVLNRALLNIEERGGVASPQEARLLREANLGQPYDRIDPSLQPMTIDERLTAATGIELQRSPREAVRTTQAIDNANAAGFAEQQQRIKTNQAAVDARTNDQIAQAAQPPAAPDSQAVISALKVGPALRTADQKTTIDQAKSRLSPEDFSILQRQAQAPALLNATERMRLKELTGQSDNSRLSNPSGGRILTTEAKFSTKRAPVPGSELKINDSGVEHTLNIVPNSKLGARGKILEQVGRIFGKKLSVFESDSLEADGFVLNSDSNTIFVNANAQTSPLAVFGHELLHQLKRDNPQAYIALEAVIKRNIKESPEMDAEYSGYDADARAEELAADLVGNRFQEGDFWSDVFNEINSLYPEQAKGIIQRLVEALVKAVDAFKAATQARGFKADEFVSDLDAVKKAITDTFVQYAQEQRPVAQEMATRAPESTATPENISSADAVFSPTRKGVAEQVGDYTIRVQKDGSIAVVGDPAEIRSMLPEGVQGRPVPGGIVFTSSAAPRVRAALEGRRLAYSRAGQVVNKLPMKDGKYIGAPEKFNKPGNISKLRKILMDLTLEGAPGRFWYERSSEEVLRMTGGDVQEARKFVALLAIYSPQAKVDANSTFALRAWAQYKAGQPISVKTGVQDKKAQEALDDVDAFWSGEKTGNFFFNLLRMIDPTTEGKQGATIDMWMMRAGQYSNDAPTATQYAFMENETNRIAQELGWEPQQVQAAIWVAMKARMENTGVKQRTEASSEKNGWIRFERRTDPETGKTKKTRVIIDEQKHRDNWLRESFALDVSADDTAQAKFDFADGVMRHIGQISWEPRPSTKLPILPGVHQAAYEDQVAFQQAVQKVLYDENGADLIAQKLGLLVDGSTPAPGVWEGDVSAGAQNRVAMAPAKGDAGKTTIDQDQKALLDSYAAILGLLLRQDGVGYHRPFYASNKSAQNGVELRIDRPFTQEEAQQLWTAIDQRMRDQNKADWEQASGLISSPVGMRIVNFGVFDDNKAFRDLMADVVGDLSIDADMVEFASDGNLISNDWTKDKNGQNYQEVLRAAGRSNILGWAADVLAPKIQAVFSDFSRRYNWGDPGSLAFLQAGRQTEATEVTAAEPVDSAPATATETVNTKATPATDINAGAPPESTQDDITASRRRPQVKENIFGERPEAQWSVPEMTAMDNRLRYWQDTLVDTKRVVQTINQQVGAIDDKFDPYLKEELFYGRAAGQTKDFLSKEVKPLMQEMARRNVTPQELEAYLHNRHAETRNKIIAERNPSMPDGGSGIKTDDARAYLANLSDNKRANLEALAARIDAITKGTREVLVASGLETRESIKQWEEQFPDYVPLNREEGDFNPRTGSMGTGSGFSVTGGTSKRAKGSTAGVVDILANVMQQRERAIVRAEKNRVSTSVFGLAASNPNPDFWLAVKPNAINDPNLDAKLMALGLDPQDARGLMADPKRGREYAIGLRIDGQDHFVFFNNNNERAKSMVESLKNVDADQLGRVMSMIGGVTRYFSSINTQYNPIFGIVNLIRDSGAGTLNLTTTPISDKKAQVVGDILPALKGIYGYLRAVRRGDPAPKGKWAEVWEQFSAAGGKTGYRDQYSNSAERARALNSELKQISEGTLKSSGRALFDWLSDFNETFENAVRLSAFKAALDKGISTERAASIAKNLTVNFNKKGEVAQQAGALYAFFNASVQGSKRTIETLGGPAGKKIIAGGIALGALQALALSMAGYEDDDPPEFLRERNFIIPTGRDEKGKATYYMFPYPLGFNVLPNAGRVMTEWALNDFKDPGKRVVQIAGSLLETFNPIGNSGMSLQTLTPTILDPAIALAENRDFSGKPIYKKNMSELDPTPGYLRARDTASAFSTVLTKFLNYASGGTEFKPGAIDISPDQIDYLIGQATGGVGREAMKIAQVTQNQITGEKTEPYKVPLAGRFYGETESDATTSARFYKNIEELNKHLNEIQGRLKSGQDIAKYMEENPDAAYSQAASKYMKMISELKKERDLVKSNDGSKDAVKYYDTRITDMMKQLNNQIKEVKDRP